MVHRRAAVANSRRASWWRVLGGRWAAPRASRDVDDIGGMGADLALEACLQSDPNSRVSPESRLAEVERIALSRDRLNGRSVL